MSKRKLKGRPEKPPAFPPLVNITLQMSDEQLEQLQREEPEHELMGVWQGELYEVYEYKVLTEDVPGGYVTWLSIKRRDKDSVHDWRHLQWIKNTICGPEREACEIFPAESRLVDTSNQYHLWVLPEGKMFPWGYVVRAVVKAEPAEDVYERGKARQRPFEPGTAPEDAKTVREAQELTEKVRKDLGLA